MKKAEKVALFAAVSYALFAAYLVVVAAVTGTRGVWAGAVLVAIRLVTSLMLLAGLRLSERHSSTFPLGLYKLQNLVSVLFGGFVIILSYELLKGNVWKLYVGHGTPHGGFLAFSSLVLSVAVAGFFAWYKAKVGKEERCPALTADSRNSLADFLAFLGVAVSIMLEMAGVRHIHSVITTIVGLYLLYAGGRVLVGGLKVLLDASVDRKTLQQVKRLAESHPLVESVVDVRGRSSGSYRFINLSLLVVTADLREAKSVAGELENRIRDSIPDVDTVKVEFDVRGKRSLLCAVAVEGPGGTVPPLFAEAPELQLLDINVSGGSVAFAERLENPVPPGSAGRGVRLAVALGLRGVDVLLSAAPALDDDVGGTLDAYGVTVLARPGVGSLAAAEVELTSFAAASGSDGTEVSP